MEQSPAAAPPATPLNPQEVLQKILDGLGIPGRIDQTEHEGAPLLHISTPDPGRLIGKHGQTLSQLQFLVNRILQRRDLNAPRVHIDCEHYRTRQNDELLQKAIEVADRVRRWGEPAQIGPFGAIERRAIEEHFAHDRELEAVSEEGDEANRKQMTIRVREHRPAPPAKHQ